MRSELVRNLVNPNREDKMRAKHRKSIRTVVTASGQSSLDRATSLPVHSGCGGVEGGNNDNVLTTFNIKHKKHNVIDTSDPPPLTSIRTSLKYYIGGHAGTFSSLHFHLSGHKLIIGPKLLQIRDALNSGVTS